MLTRMQRDTLVIIADGIKADGMSPTFDEIARKLNLRSKSGVTRLVDALEGRGFIRRLPNRARAIEVLKMPPGVGDSAVAAERERCASIVGLIALGRLPFIDGARAINEGTPLDQINAVSVVGDN